MYHLFVESKKKKDTNELIYKTERDSKTENRLVVAKGEGTRGEREWEFGISRCKHISDG